MYKYIFIFKYIKFTSTNLTKFELLLDLKFMIKINIWLQKTTYLAKNNRIVFLYM